MNKLLSIVFIGLLCMSNLLGQVQNDVKKILETRDFVAFKLFADSLNDREKRIDSHWECLRDLTDDYKEGIFIFEYSVPEDDNPAISSVYTFRVTLIATKTQIAYYELSEKKSKEVDNHWVPYFELIDKFKDETLFKELKIAFKNIFQTDLNENELFICDFVFGERCGNAGFNPIGRQQINEWVTNENKAELLKWLKSTNTEKQIYALDGLYQLKKAGTKITDTELRIIKFVISKSGTIYVCSGCIHWRENISDKTEKFKF